MTLREVTRTVIKLVEDASGCPVVVSEDRSLTTLAASRIARGANRIHSISFNPSAVSEPDYLICYQCGFILRLFGIPAAGRVDLACANYTLQWIERSSRAMAGRTSIPAMVFTKTNAARPATRSVPPPAAISCADS